AATGSGGLARPGKIGKLQRSLIDFPRHSIAGPRNNMKQVTYRGRGLLAFALLIAALLSLRVTAAPAQRATEAAQLKQAISNLKAHDLGKAEAALQAILKRRPAQPDALNFMGVLRAEQKRSAEAEAFFKR